MKRLFDWEVAERNEAIITRHDKRMSAEEVALLLNDLYYSLRALVSCVERDSGKGGILLPTPAALESAKSVILRSESHSERQETK